MTPEGLEKLRSVGHCQFAFASDRNLEDYVYNASDLRDLPGRKYQSNATTSTASRRNTNTATSL